MEKHFLRHFSSVAVALCLVLLSQVTTTGNPTFDNVNLEVVEGGIIRGQISRRIHTSFSNFEQRVWIGLFKNSQMIAGIDDPSFKFPVHSGSYGSVQQWRDFELAVPNNATLDGDMTLQLKMEGGWDVIFGYNEDKENIRVLDDELAVSYLVGLEVEKTAVDDNEKPRFFIRYLESQPDPAMKVERTVRCSVSDIGFDGSEKHLGYLTVQIGKNESRVEIALPDSYIQNRSNSRGVLVSLVDNVGQYRVSPNHRQAWATYVKTDPGVSIESFVNVISRQDPDDLGIFLVRRGGDLAAPLTVDLSIVPGLSTAVEGLDYTPFETSVTIHENLSVGGAFVWPPEAAALRGVKQLVVSIVPKPSDYLVSSPSTAAIAIVDELSPPGRGRSGTLFPVRGGGSDLDRQTFLVPMHGLQGERLEEFDPSLGSAVVYHYLDGQPDQSNVANRWKCNNPIMAFGGRGRDPIWYGREYVIGVGLANYGIGQEDPTRATSVAIKAYRKSDGALVGVQHLKVPHLDDPDDWNTYLLDQGLKRTVVGNGLETSVVVTRQPGFVGADLRGFVLSHRADPTAGQFTYVIEANGTVEIDGGGAFPLSIDAAGNPADQQLYSLEFSARPPWTSKLIAQPRFDSEPMPSVYGGKSPDELQTYGSEVNVGISRLPNSSKTLGVSPELWGHPALDKLVEDLNGDPLALANYVFNEIELSDAVDVGILEDIDDWQSGPAPGGAFSAINCGGVNRGALGVYLEGQGSPIEQCSLLVYLLRKAGHDALYVFPESGKIKMAEGRMSRILRMQLNGARNSQLGFDYQGTGLVTVNYPWVAVRIGDEWKHLFPWIKDTKVEEGFDVSDFLPSRFRSGISVVDDYLHNLLNDYSTDDDDTLGVIFPRYLLDRLATTAPGVSIDDIGMRFVNRRHHYSDWSEFPTPTLVEADANVGVFEVESLGAEADIAAVSDSLSDGKIFNTLEIDVFSQADPERRVATGSLRLANIHNRKLFITHSVVDGESVRSSLVMGPFDQGAMGPTVSFEEADTVAEQRGRLESSTVLGTGDDELIVRMKVKRNRYGNSAAGLLSPDRYLGVSSQSEFSSDRPIRKGDLAAVCVNIGRVTPRMLQIHAKEVADMQRLIAEGSATAASDVYHGTIAYSLGMNYYARCDRFGAVFADLYKVQTVRNFGIGLAKLSPRRIGGAFAEGAIDLVWPSVDMFLQETVSVGNKSVHLESGEPAWMATRDHNALDFATRSAQEHAILNQFFGRSDSVSSVKVLQLADMSADNSKNIVELTRDNYEVEGNKVYGGLPLKNHRPSIWDDMVEVLESAEGHGVAWMPKQPISTATGSFSGMAGLALSYAVSSAPIGDMQYGGFGAKVGNGTFTEANVVNIGLLQNVDGDLRVVYEAPTISNPEIVESTPINNVSETISRLDNDTAVSPGLFHDKAAIENFLRYDGMSGPSMNPGDWLELTTDRGSIGNVDDRGGFFNKIADPVNLMSGEFYLDGVDLTLPGPFPLEIRRNYGSQSLAQGAFGFGWKMGFVDYLSYSDTALPVADTLYATDLDGSTLAYEAYEFGGDGKPTAWKPTQGKNPNLSNHTDDGIGAVANKFNNRINKRIEGATTVYELTGGDGSRRRYEVRSYPIPGSSITRQRPYLVKWTDHRGNYLEFKRGGDLPGENNTAEDWGLLRRIQSSNGQMVRFLYDVYGRIVEALTLDGRRIRYEYDRHGDLVRVVKADGSEIEYEYRHDAETIQTGATPVAAVVSSHLLEKEIKPDGRVLKNVYDDKRRVTEQWATVGEDLALIKNAVFDYDNDLDAAGVTESTLANPFLALSGTTTVRDYLGRPLVYEYSDGLITRITDPRLAQITQEWYSESDVVNGVVGAYGRSLKKTTDKRGLVTEFMYDARGNATNITVRGDLTGSGTAASATTTAHFLNDPQPGAAGVVRNLPWMRIDPSGNTNFFRYGNDWLVDEIEHHPKGWYPHTDRIIKATHEYQDFHDATAGRHAYGMKTKVVQAKASEDEATTIWEYDARGYVTAIRRPTGTGDPEVVVRQRHNDRGELVEQWDSDRRTVRYAYDAYGRTTAKEVFDAVAGVVASVPSAWNYYYYNENGELTWEDGPRFDPEDYSWRDYDGAGRKTEETVWRSRAMADGSGVEAETGDDLYATMSYQYDPFSNLRRITDPYGRYVMKDYDATGNLLSESRFDTDGTLLDTAGFEYYPSGDLSRIRNAANAGSEIKGLTQFGYNQTGKKILELRADAGEVLEWRYYPDGRVNRTTFRNGAYQVAEYADADRAVTNVYYSASGVPLSTNAVVRDRRGNVVVSSDATHRVTLTAYDDLDRVTQVQGPPGDAASARQTTTHVYDASGRKHVVKNGLLETIETETDALGRTKKTTVRGAPPSANVAAVTEVSYGNDHHSVTTTSGSGAAALEVTVFTDNAGRTVLSRTRPGENVVLHTRSAYDKVGNLTFSWDERGVVTERQYDGRNRLAREILPGGLEGNREISYGYDVLGNLTRRTMPGGLKWKAEYDEAGRIKYEKSYALSESDPATHVDYFYSTSGASIGLLGLSIDQKRSTAKEYEYDHWLRPSRVHAFGFGSVPSADVLTEYSYDVRGLLTNALETTERTYPSTPPYPALNGLPVVGATRVARAFDQYGQLREETVSIQEFGDWFENSRFLQEWDAAGRRSRLVAGEWNGDGFAQDGGRFDQTQLYDAAGRLRQILQGGQTFTFNYADNGLLTARQNPWRTMAVSARDGLGRRKTTSTTVGGVSVLGETMTWRTDSRLESYAAVRSGKDAWNETHAFGYNGRHQLVSEARSGTGGALTLTHSHDQAGLGVRVAMIESGSLDNGWVAAPQSTQIPTLDQFGRVADERIAASIFKLRAHGTASGVSGLTAKLDNTVVSGLAYDVVGTESTWWVDLSLDPGTHVLKVEGKDRLNRPVTKQSSFTLAGDRSIHTDFLGGHVSQRTETGGNGERQEFIWDARGRLLSVMTHTADPQEPVRGFHAVYDAMGRRLRTIDADHIYGIRSSLAFDTHVYDPQTEFLEIGLVRGFLDLASSQPQGYNRHRANSWHWMVYGPDDAGRQGGMQGLGGLEASFEVSAAGLSLTPPQSPVWTAVVTDHFGHTLATVKGGQTAWNPTRVDGYGAVQGYRAPVSIEASYLSFFPKPDRVSPLEATLWRGKRIDPTGYYWIGARYYDPVGGRFLSPDPMGHAATWDLYSFANGDPINYYDPDGRLAAGFYQGWNSGSSPAGSSGAFDAAYWLGGVLGGFNEGYEGGRQITANTLTFGATDSLGMTHSYDYQGWEYDGTRVLATGGRELLITAATMGSAQAFRATGQLGYGALAAGGEVYSTYQNASAIVDGYQNVQNGNNWGFLQAGLGSLGLRGNVSAFGDLADGFGSIAANSGRIYSEIGGNGMDPAMFDRIQTAFQKQPGRVMASNAGSELHLGPNLKIEGETLSQNVIMLRMNPSTSSVYEELIHTAQLRRGMDPKTQLVEMEIQAAQKLLKFADKYKIPAAESAETARRLLKLQGGSR